MDKAELVQKFQEMDSQILQTSNQLMIALQQQLNAKKRLTIKELGDMTSTLASLQKIQSELKGDSAKALLVLVSQGIIPVAAIPQILSALEKSEIQINADASKALRGTD